MLRELHWGRCFRALLLILLLAIVVVPPRTSASPAHQQPRRLIANEPQEGHISDTIPEETWTFEGFEGDLILIDMHSEAVNQLDSYLTLLDASGSTLTANDDSGQGLDARIGPFTLPATGSYTVLAGRYSGEGPYSLLLQNLNTLPIVQLGKPVGGTVDADHPADLFLLQLSPAEVTDLLQLAVIPDSDFAAPLIELYGPDSLIASTEFQPEAYLDPIVVQPDVRYVIAINWNQATGGGPYRLQLSTSNVQLLVDGTEQLGELTFEQYAQTHYFRADSGQRVRVTVRAESGIAPAIDITSADFATFLFSNSGEGTHSVSVETEIPVTGVYVIEVRDGTFSGEEGAYTLLLEFIDN